MNDEAADYIELAESFAENPADWGWAADSYTQAGIILWEENHEEAKLYFRKALILEPENHRANRYLKHPPSDPDGVTANLPNQPQPPLSGHETIKRTDPLSDESEEG